MRPLTSGIVTLQAPVIRRASLIAAVLAALFFLLLALDIRQPADYHRFADRRALFGIPHFWNIVSNLPFLAIGLMGLDLLRRRDVAAAAPWAAVFGGTALVAFGSGYYHSAPGDATLVWDRIPIGIAFMGLLAALFAEHLDSAGRRLTCWLLIPLIVFAVGAVLWWRASGELGAWVWVQLAPMLAVVLVLRYLPGQYTHRRYFAYALACYAAAKLCELADHEIMALTAGLVSGHALKHAMAGAGVWCFYVMLRDRRRCA